MNIVALDVSLNCTGYATSSGCGVLVPPKSAERGYERVRWILDSIWNLTETADLTLIEGYAFGVKNQQGIISIHELGGVIRFTFWENGRRLLEIAPKSIKAFATGNGNASKDEMLLAAVRKLGYEGNSKDEADALWLREMALAHYEQRPVNAKQKEAIGKVQWPQWNPQSLAVSA
jgi:Holliday junction resolvasome RuvABC endonuclease subunit